jgi:serine/threonine-protein kinase HipA
VKQLEVRFTHRAGDERLVGTLAQDEGRVYFEYHPDYLRDGWSLSPFRLPFESRLFEHQDRAFGPLPGLFDDSLPDGWGLLLMDRYFRSQRLRLETIDPLDRLAWLGTRTMGALTYHPPRPLEEIDQRIFDLHALAHQALRVYEGRTEEILPQLIQAGGSPGGARPKVLVGFDPQADRIVSGADELPAGFAHWLVKFSAREDLSDAGPIEFAYAQMARAAGIHTPEARLFETAQGDRFFGTRRFDRRQDRRFHVHTFGNLIQANFRIPSCDYEDLLRATSLLTRNQAQVLSAFRIMVFNVLAHNRDDHVKNIAFLLDDPSGDWSLAPAYDLTFSSGPGGQHSMTLAGEGRAPGREHMLQLADKAGLPERSVKDVLAQVSDAVSHWPNFARQASVSSEATDRITQVLA